MDGPGHKPAGCSDSGIFRCAGGARGPFKAQKWGGVASMDKWDVRFMELTRQVGSWSSCFQPGRHVGAIIVRDKRVMTTGYNGAPAGIVSCVEKGRCLRREMEIASGTRQELCYAVHAEQNAIIQAAKYGISVNGATLYCTHQPCVICAKMIINAGIRRVVYEQGYPDAFSLQLFREAGTVLEKFVPPDEDGPAEEGK